jgi:hypothetical protein
MYQFQLQVMDRVGVAVLPRGAYYRRQGLKHLWRWSHKMQHFKKLRHTQQQRASRHILLDSVLPNKLTQLVHNQTLVLSLISLFVPLADRLMWTPYDLTFCIMGTVDQSLQGFACHEAA